MVVVFGPDISLGNFWC